MFIFPGLSYTRFEMAWITQSMPPQSKHALAQGIVFQIAIENTGAVASGKTVQLYLRATNVANAPRRQLIALTKIYVEPSQSVIVSLNTSEFANFCAFCVVDESGKPSIPSGTAYSISVGDGASDYFSAFNLTAA